MLKLDSSGSPLQLDIYQEPKSQLLDKKYCLYNYQIIGDIMNSNHK